MNDMVTPLEQAVHTSRALASEANMPQEYLSFNDLAGLDSSPNAVREKFKDIFGIQPDGIALNKETYYDAIQPPITEQYGHYCYKKLGQYTFSNDTSNPPENAIVGTNTAYNYGDTEAEISLSVQGQWSETVGWSSSITSGLTFSQEFGIEGIFKMGMSFSVSVTAGRSGSSSTTRTATATVSVKVPPRSKVEVSMVGIMQSESMDYSVPIAVSGMFGANFPKRVNDHYFWFYSAESLLPKTSGVISGTIKGTSVFNVHTEIGKAEPIQD